MGKLSKDRSEVGFGHTPPKVSLSWDTLPRSMSGLQPVNQAAPLEGSQNVRNGYNSIQ